MAAVNASPAPMVSATLTGKPGCWCHSSRVTSRLPLPPQVMATILQGWKLRQQTLGAEAQSFRQLHRSRRHSQQRQNQRNLGVIHLDIRWPVRAIPGSFRWNRTAHVDSRRRCECIGRMFARPGSGWFGAIQCCAAPAIRSRWRRRVLRACTHSSESSIESHAAG